MYRPIQMFVQCIIIFVWFKKMFYTLKNVTFQEWSRVPKNVFVTFLKECVYNVKKCLGDVKKCVKTLTEYMWHVLEKSVCKFKNVEPRKRVLCSFIKCLLSLRKCKTCSWKNITMYSKSF